jgi:hypothetical protein
MLDQVFAQEALAEVCRLIPDLAHVSGAPLTLKADSAIARIPGSGVITITERLVRIPHPRHPRLYVMSIAGKLRLTFVPAGSPSVVTYCA